MADVTTRLDSFTAVPTEADGTLRLFLLWLSALLRCRFLVLRYVGAIYFRYVPYRYVPYSGVIRHVWRCLNVVYRYVPFLYRYVPYSGAIYVPYSGAIAKGTRLFHFLNGRHFVFTRHPFDGKQW